MERLHSHRDTQSGVREEIGLKVYVWESTMFGYYLKPGG